MCVCVCVCVCLCVGMFPMSSMSSTHVRLPRAFFECAPRIRCIEDSVALIRYAAANLQHGFSVKMDPRGKHERAATDVKVHLLGARQDVEKCENFAFSLGGKSIPLDDERPSKRSRTDAPYSSR